MPVVIQLAGVVAAVAACLLAVDFLSGLLHWVEDTWTVPGISPALDAYVVNDNIEHHRTPGSIRRGSYWQTNRVCMTLAGGAAAALPVLHVHAWEPYLIVALGSQANQVHKWAHTANPPAAIALLQRAGVLQSARHHAVHHKSPYARRFCTYTNFLNPVLDGTGFWRALESALTCCGLTVARATPARFGY